MAHDRLASGPVRLLHPGVQFGSDNHPGASPQVMEMIVASNLGHTHGYGDDEWTRRAKAALTEVFECDLEVILVTTGTAANSLALACMVQPWQSILCHSQAHLLLDESTAPEFFTGGARLVGISGRDGKIERHHLARALTSIGSDAPHHSQPAALSLAQVSELGLVYSPEEVGSVTELAHHHRLTVHMDGARFANAVASIGCSPAELSWKAGVDVLSLGATKSGCLAAEAVVFFKTELAAHAAYRRKRAGHLLSKGRFLGAQMVGWLHHRHWLDLAAHANTHAGRLAQRIAAIAGVRVVWPALANEVFVVMPAVMAEGLRAAGATFYDWYRDSLPEPIQLHPEDVFLRLVTSFATHDGHINDFCAIANQYAATR